METMPALRLAGPSAETVARTEPEGLRVTLPDGRADTRVVGVDFPVRIRGDFDIALSYEVLGVASPPPSLGAGPHLRVVFESPTRLDALAHRLRTPRSDTAESYRVVNDARGQEQFLRRGGTAAKEARGKLRIVRLGTRVQYFAADGEGEYKDIGSEELGAEDVKLVRAFASSGWKPVFTDLRLIDLTIDADSFPDGVAANLPADSPELTAAPPAGIEGQRWVVVVAVLGLLLTLGFAVGLGVWLYQRHRAALQPQPAAIAANTSAAGVVAFPCPECGKGLRAKSELAGRKVKCTQCACAVVVPANRRRTPPHGVVRSS
jgi:hypothetical protein